MTPAVAFALLQLVNYSGLSEGPGSPAYGCVMMPIAPLFFCGG